METRHFRQPCVKVNVSFTRNPCREMMKYVLSYLALNGFDAFNIYRIEQRYLGSRAKGRQSLQKRFPQRRRQRRTILRITTQIPKTSPSLRGVIISSETILKNKKLLSFLVIKLWYFCFSACSDQWSKRETQIFKRQIFETNICSTFYAICC